MKKRIFSTLLAAVMVVTAIPSAFAAKKVEDKSTAGKNIYADISSLETQAQLDKLNFAKSTATIVDGGYDGGKCVKVQLNGDWGGMRFPMPSVAGETYDISFWIKTDDAPAVMDPIMYYDGLENNHWAYIKPSGKFTNEWTQYTTTWECTGITDNGQKSEGSGEIDIRYGTGQERKSYYVDDLRVVPHGNVPTADYSSLKLGKQAVTVVKEDNKNAEPIEVAPVEFSDMEHHWAKNTVNRLATCGYIDGMGNNMYVPDSNVTRAQFVKMMVDLFDVSEQKYNASYGDIKGDEWFASPVSIATAAGFIDSAMTFGNRFLPDQAITREEAATIATKIAEEKGAEKKTENASFTDDAAISAWAKAGVKDAAEYGLILGYEDGSYKPQANITRAEAAAILLRVAELTTRLAVFVDADNGNDKNDGTENAPLKTVYEARDRVRQWNNDMQNDIYVYIRGEHYLDSAFQLGAEDSGRNGHRVVYTSWGDEKPTLTMGKKYTGFQMHDPNLNIYKVFVGPVQSRQAYFNNVRGIRARNLNGFKDPEYISDATHLTYHTADTELLNFKYPTEIEGVWHVNWINPRILIESVKPLDDDTVEIRLTQKFKEFTSNNSQWSNLQDHRLYPSYLENAYEFLNEPSEWYLDSHAGFLYYIPREGEDMSTMVATLPVGESILEVVGNSGTDPVRNLTFDNIEFADVGYMRTTTNGGNYAMQNNTISEYSAADMQDTMPQHSMWMSNAYYINFTNNRLTRLGSSGLLTSKAIQHLNVVGNEFFDISGNGINLGNPIRGYTSRGNLSADQRNPRSQADWNAWNKVENNFFYGIGLEYENAAAIGAAFPRHSTIRYNYIGTTPYSGMHIGWGWGGYAAEGSNIYDLEISHNYISESSNGRIYDGASIYTLGSTSLLSKDVEHRNGICQNYFENPRNAYGAVYNDEGSTGWHIFENVTNFKDVTAWKYNFGDHAYNYNDQGSNWRTSLYWLNWWNPSVQYNMADNNYSTVGLYRDTTLSDTNVVKDTYVYPDADWPEEAQAIIDNAYIQPEYLDNFDKKDGPLSFVSREREYEIAIGEQVPLDFKIYGNYMKEYDPKDFDIDFWVSDPDVLTVDENGLMTAHGTGIVRVVANANINGFIQVKEYNILAGEKIETLETNPTTLNMIKGYTANIQVNSVTSFGKLAVVENSNIEFTSADPSIASVDSEGLVTGHNVGETTIKVVASDSGITVVKEIPTKIIAVSSQDALEQPYEDVPQAFFDPTKWTGKAALNGNKIAVSGSPGLYVNAWNNQLYAFDMTIEPETTWPSLSLCSSEIMASYTNSNVYMIGFKEDHIEFQRFNKGQRTMIFGDASFSPIGGPGIPNNSSDPIFRYGEPMSVIVGALEHPEGTRIVLTINGVNIFDYIDNDANAVVPNGFFGVYDQFTFAPYTGRTVQSDK